MVNRSFYHIRLFGKIRYLTATFHAMRLVEVFNR